MYFSNSDGDENPPQTPNASSQPTSPMEAPMKNEVTPTKESCSNFVEQTVRKKLLDSVTKTPQKNERYYLISMML